MFVVGEQRRGELTRYDEKADRFEPFLEGISANDLQFSHDGKWIAYVTYPDRMLLAKPGRWERAAPTLHFTHARLHADLVAR